MTTQSWTPDFLGAVAAYAEEHATPLSPVIAELVATTYADVPDAGMISGRSVGNLLQLLVAVTGAMRVLEVGTFTGFSALMMAEALPPTGSLIACEIDPDRAAFAQRFFDKSPHGSKIQLRVGPALASMTTMEPGFDLVFIDADKEGYRDYYERALELLGPRGLIVVDNVLWGGAVLDPKDETTEQIAAFNRHVANDPRVQHVMLTVRDGLLLVRRITDTEEQG